MAWDTCLQSQHWGGGNRRSRNSKSAPATYQVLGQPGCTRDPTTNKKTNKNLLQDFSFSLVSASNRVPLHHPVSHPSRNVSSLTKLSINSPMTSESRALNIDAVYSGWLTCPLLSPVVVVVVVSPCACVCTHVHEEAIV